MHPKLAFLILPYTRAELPGWGRLLKLVGFGTALGGAQPMSPEWRMLPEVVVRGKRHGFLMQLDRSDWAQCCTYFLGRYYELGVQRTLDLLLQEGDLFVDVGANIGMITLHARHLIGATGRIDCFEPNPQCVNAIRGHVRMNGIENVFVHPCALSDAPGSLDLSLTSEHSGTATLVDVGNDAIRTIKVDVRIGDDAIEGAPRVIKIDVEGFELNVLKGLRRTLSMHKPFVVTELIESHLNKAGTNVAEVSGFLFDLGYVAYGISSARALLRHDLVLQRVARGSDFRSFTDYLWVHPDNPADLERHVRAKVVSQSA